MLPVNNTPYGLRKYNLWHNERTMSTYRYYERFSNSELELNRPCLKMLQLLFAYSTNLQRFPQREARLVLEI